MCRKKKKSIVQRSSICVFLCFFLSFARARMSFSKFSLAMKIRLDLMTAICEILCDPKGFSVYALSIVIPIKVFYYNWNYVLVKLISIF